MTSNDTDNPNASPKHEDPSNQHSDAGNSSDQGPETRSVTPTLPPTEDLPETPSSTNPSTLTDSNSPIVEDIKPGDARIIADSIANLFVEAVASRLSKLKSLEEHANEVAGNDENKTSEGSDNSESEDKGEQGSNSSENEDNRENADGNEKTDEKELKWTEDDAFVLEVEDFESIDDKSPSQIEWSRRKREENQQNEHLDRLMCIVGHEEVKAFFLSIMDKVKVLKLWDKNLSDWSFDLVLKGNYGTRRNRIAQLYAEFLYSIGIVRNRNFAINDGYSPSEQDSMATVVFFSDADRIDRKSEIEEIMKVAKKPEFRTVVILSYEVLSDSSKEALDVNEESRHRFSNHLVLEDYGEKETLEFMKHLCKSKPEYRFEADALLETLAKQIHKRHSGNQFQNADTLPQELEKVWQKSQIRVQDAWYSWAKTHSPGDGHEFSAEGGDRDKIIIEDILETATAPEPAAEIEDFRVNSPAWKSLQQLVGLKSVKEDLGLLFDMAQYNKQQEKNGRKPLATTYNRCFLGNPGVGKTTVAELYAKMLSELGIVSGGHVVTKRASDLLGKYIGWSESNTTKALEEANGGVLIIDDAHLLYQESSCSKSSDSFRNGIIDTLVANISGSASEDRCVILCGYADRMQNMFLKTNPGLQRRFPMENSLHFANYTDEELHQILKQKMERDDLTATDEAHGVARETLSRMRRRPNFGNGGDVETLLSRAKVHRITRLKDSTIGFADFHNQALEPQDFDPDFDRSRRADKHRNSLFQDFVGFDSVIGKFQRYQKMADGMRRCGVDPKLHIPWAFVFSGPPGTGKTSTARKVGRLFYDMGFISSADVVTCSVTNLIGQHLGTTGPKVIDQFERGLGKVLFIDEAYRLIGDSYHQDAVGEIVDTMTNPRYARNMVVILAGYGKEMETLLSTNPGLRSRFPTVIDFPHMSPEHCLQLLSNLLATFNIGIPKSIVQPGGAENTTVIRALTQLTATEGWASGRDIESLSKNVAEHVFAIVGESDDTYEPGTLQVSFEELMDALRAMLNQKGGTWSRLMEEENYPEYAGRQQRFGKVLPPRYV
ncbi:nfx1-type zinc finger-containing protein 1 protein [Fusarium langsethiae]|uniref:Nfx1-type zinc finger-containing protein 1 protein n=1 Tax=Fusarium langsethiae TaxID=179993 RepID=A0A0M9EM54_FUSLA|nr:nfx1-type zinc finger-containing protein 1 protein [Fusarium langsethiae]